MEPAGIALAGALGIFAFFGGIALLMWIEGRNKRHERDRKHAERMKALEMGQPLPDLAIAQTHAAVARTVLLIVACCLVPPALAGAAIGATALVLHNAQHDIHLPVLCVIWGVVGLVSLVVVTSALGAIASHKAGDGEDNTAETDKSHRGTGPSQITAANGGIPKEMLMERRP